MPAIEKHRGLPVRRGELEPAGRCHVCDLYLGNDAGDRAVAKGIFGEREDLCILAALGIEDAVGGKTDLFEARRVEVELAQRPQDREAGSGKACRDPRGEQGRRRVVVQARGGAGDLVQPGAVESLIGEAIVQRG